MSQNDDSAIYVFEAVAQGGGGRELAWRWRHGVGSPAPADRRQAPRSGLPLGG